MNEQFTQEPNERPRILIVDNNSKFARSARLLLDQSGNYIAGIRVALWGYLSALLKSVDNKL